MRFLLPLLLVELEGTAATGQERPVLAYLFTLRRARHPLPHVWTNYFQGCEPGSYKIHIHVDPTFNGTRAPETGPAARFFKQANVLPRAYLDKVRRFGHELVRARMRLLRFALTGSIGQQSPMWYSFFSESCAPISTCAVAHAYLQQLDVANKSFVAGDSASGAYPKAVYQRDMNSEQQANSDKWRSEFAVICPRCAAAGIPASDFRYSPGWVTLWRAHAQDLVEKEAVYDDAFAHWGWSKLVNGIPDESYWSTLAQARTTSRAGGFELALRALSFSTVDEARERSQRAYVCVCAPARAYERVRMSACVHARVCQPHVGSS